MGAFLDRTLGRVPAGFDFDDALRRLVAWIDDRGNVVVGHDGDLYGSLHGRGESGGTRIELRGYTAEETVSYARSWFGETTGKPDERLWPFVQTGGDGSMGALWLDDDGATRIVHLGSGSGSLLTCVLAESGLDFLRLLAIGYEDLCWSEEFAAAPRPWKPDGDTVNRPYRDWLQASFDVTIPATALEIVREPSEAGDPETTDPFCRWVNRLTG